MRWRSGAQFRGRPPAVPRGRPRGLAPGRLPEDFVAAVFAQKTGERGAPFQTELGWHIVEVTERRPARQAELAEVRGEIERPPQVAEEAGRRRHQRRGPQQRDELHGTIPHSRPA